MKVLTPGGINVNASDLDLNRSVIWPDPNLYKWRCYRRALDTWSWWFID